MLGNRCQRHFERLGHIGDRHVIFQKHGQDRPAGRVGEGGEDRRRAAAASRSCAISARADQSSTDRLNMPKSPDLASFAAAMGASPRSGSHKKYYV